MDKNDGPFQPLLFEEWTAECHDRLLDVVRPLPKIELHAHLSGCLRLSTVRELIETQNLDVPSTVRTNPKSALTFHQRARSYAASFWPWRAALNKVMEIPDILPRLVNEVAEDFAQEGIVYAELRVSPRLPVQNSKLLEFLSSFAAAAGAARQRLGIDLRAILGFTRQRFYRLTPEEQDDAVQKILSAAERFHGTVVVGFDLWGDETRHPPRAFERVFRTIRESGYPLTIHAGEIYSASAIRDAVQLLRCRRLGHATAITKDPRLFELIRDQDVLVEVCLTSNLITGVVEDLRSHPLRAMVANRVSTALCADDTLVFNTSLSIEMTKALRLSLLTPDCLPRLFTDGVIHAFAPLEDREAITKKYAKDYTPEVIRQIQDLISEDGC